MTSTISGSEALREDTRRRVRVPAERRERLVDEFEKSGLSAARFARLAGVKYPTFANWTARRRRERQEVKMGEEDGVKGRSGPIRLVEAVIGGGREGMMNDAVGDGLSIELPGGSRVVVGSPVQLQMAVELIALVAQRMGARC